MSQQLSQQLTTLPILERLVHYTNANGVLNEFVASSKSLYNEATKRIDYRAMKYKYSLKIAIKYNDLPVIRWLNKNGYNKGDFWLIDEAAKYGHLELIQYFHKNGVGCTCKAIYNATMNDHLEVVKWLCENKKEKFIGHAGYAPDFIYWAVLNGYFGFIKIMYMHKLDTRRYSTILLNSTINAMDWAAGIGHLEVVKWLHENRQEGCTKTAMDAAAWNGHLEVIKWLHENRKEGCTKKAMDYAAENGQLEVVKWLHENRQEGCTTDAMDWAATRGFLEVVKWLHQNRNEGCTTDAMNLAAENGYLEVVKWLHLNRKEGCTTKAMNMAARNGHLEVVKWLHQNRQEGCTTDAMNLAAEKGHQEVIKYLRENNLV
jgi:ankyrin repeat protein